MIKNVTIVTGLIVTDKVISRLAWDQGYYILYFFTYKPILVISHDPKS